MGAFWPQAVLASYRAAADLTAAQWTFVKFDANGDVIAAAAITDVPVGVLQNAPKVGETAEVCVIGGSKVKASAAIPIGSLIGTAANGRAVTVTPGTSTTAYILGRIEGPAATANGDIFTAFIDCAIPSRAA